MTTDNHGLDARLRQSTFADESEEYAEFVKKFSAAKKNTDDCYTPPAVYDAVLAWVKRRYQIASAAPIVRPFYPGGDYEAFDYPPDCVVVDNPPFSIARRIFRFYSARRIGFFCFYAGLMGLSPCSRRNHVGAVFAPPGCIVYTNGALVRTSFATNLGGDILEIAPDLGEAIEAALGKCKAARAAVKRVRRWPREALCSSAHLMSIRAPLRIPFAEAAEIDALDNAGGIFGGGLLLSPAAVERVEQVEQVELSARERAESERLEEEWEKNYAK